MDEAVVRIVLEELGGQAGPSKSPSASAPTPTSAPAPVPLPVPKSALDTTGLAKIGADMGNGVVDNLYKGLFDALQKGSDKFAGVVDPLLTKAKPFFTQGLIKSPDDLKKLAQSGFGSTTPQPQPAVQPPPPRDWINDLVKGIEGANRHVLVEGQSGSGKSLLTRHIAFQRMAQGEEVSVVDTHAPELWGGAKQVFQGTNEQAGSAAADFLRQSLEARKLEAQEAKSRGEVPKFKDMTIVFSDFARLMKDTPQLGEEFKTLLTEARKFRISIVADTTALTAAATGVKGIQDVLQNFAQKVKLYAPTAEQPKRTAEVAGKTYETPLLPEYKERIDYGLVKPPPPPEPPEPPFDPQEEARKRYEREQRTKAVDAAYKAQYGGEEKGGGILGFLQAIRGTIGGAFGQFAGSALDVTSAAASGATGAAALGAVGAVIAALTEAAKIISGIVRTFGVDQTRYLGQLRAKLASPGTDPAEAMETMGDAIVQGAQLTQKKIEATAGQIPILGGLISGIASIFTGLDEAAGEATKALANLAKQTQGQADRYAAFSPELATAQAGASVKQVLGDLRRAREVSPALTQFTEERAMLQQRIEDAKSKMIENNVADVLAEMRRIAERVESMAEFGRNIPEQLKWVARTYPWLVGIDEKLGSISGLIRSFQQGMGEDPTSIILKGVFPFQFSRGQGE